MSYRSFKRVVGETNLERKCRILFGAALFLLMSGAFWYACWTAEDLVTDGPLRTGRFVVDQMIRSYHHERAWEQVPAHRLAAQELNRELGSQNFEWEMLTLEMDGVREVPTKDWERRTRQAATPFERDLLEELEAEVDAAFEAYGRERFVVSPRSAVPSGPRDLDQAPARPGDSGDSPRTNGADLGSDEEGDSPFSSPVHRLIQSENAYHYYQPVYWRMPYCNQACHQNVMQSVDGVPVAHRYAYSAEEWRQLGRPSTLRVMKVVIPSEPTRNEIIQTRAILSTVAIATVSFSMLALYFVVKYVIMKPLNHLREISDEISRGNYDLRANIQTGDEFEELAASFNRMLRHLVTAQTELRNLNRDFDAKFDELAQANMQLHEMNRVKSDFLANMSHELRTPLNSIIGFADVLKDHDSLKDKQRRYAENIATSGRALLDMINDILDLAKTESGKMDVRLTEFQIGPAVHSQCDLVRSLSEEKNIDLSISIQPDLPPLYQDQGKIQQILLNLLSNAIKFTPEGGRITVAARRDPMRHLVLTVQDTGVGIAEEDREIIFEKFRQGGKQLGGDHLTREYSGTGLGLSIVKEMSRLLGGEVFVESELGKGSTFHVRVPWTLADRPKVDVTLTQRLDEVTKPRRLDFSGSATN